MQQLVKTINCGVKLAKSQLRSNYARQISQVSRFHVKNTLSACGGFTTKREVPVAAIIVAMCSAVAVTTIHCKTTNTALKADELYNNPKYDRRCLLQDLKQYFADAPNDTEVMWRLARAAYDVANLPATPASEKKELTYYAKEIIQQALDASDKNFAIHKWYGIILSSIGDFEGSKVSISNSFIVKNHWLKAIELNPTDATSHHLLGRWSLTIADISWIERKIAAAVFGTPPQSSYEEALSYFLQADAISPGFWKKNSFMIAKCYEKLGKKGEAKEWIEKTLAVPVKNEEDEGVQKEAQALLGKYK